MSYDYILQKANDLYLNGALDEAEKLYRLVLVTMPKHPDILNMLGLIAQAKGQHSTAADYFYQAIENAPNHWPIRFNLAVSLVGMQKYTQAVDAYQAAIKMKPDLKEAYQNIAAIYEKTGHNDMAGYYYQCALDIDPDYIEAAVCLAALQNRMDTLQNLTQTHPDSALPYYYLAQNAFQNAQYADALQYITKAKNIDHEAVDINLLLGQIYLRLSNFEKAKQAFYQVIVADKNQTEALLSLAILEKDETFFKRVLDLQPNNVRAHTAYADFLSEQKRILEALEEYRQAVILDPDSPQLSNNLALILKDTGEYEQALDLFFNAFLAAPEQPEIAQNITQTLMYLYRQQPEKALKIAQDWVNTAPKNLWAIQTLAFFNGRTTSLELLYNEKLFDAFADDYEQTMRNLQYRAISNFRDLNIPLCGTILDLGCGTGLAAQILKTPDNSFIGVDVSQKMLDIAAEKNVYQVLIKSDIKQYLQTTDEQFDAVTAFDTFNYLKNPEQLFMYISPKLLVFTIENAPSNVPDNRLMPNGRYQHNPDFIFNRLKQSGYEKISANALIIRNENGKAVEGTLFIAR